MQKFYSTAVAILKSGGPKMSVRWYINDHQLEASWSENGHEKVSVYNADELELVDEHHHTDFADLKL